LPFNAVDVTLTVVFKGNLGAESTNAVAIGFKDISEPTPIDLFNNTNKVCFNGSYVNYDDAALWDAVDINPKNGKIDCLNNAEINITRNRIKPIYLSFNGQPANSTNYFFKYENGLEFLPGETPLRFYVLADVYPAPINFSVAVYAQSMDNINDCLPTYSNDVNSVDPYKNKLVWISSLAEPGGGHYKPDFSPISNFRGFPVWILSFYENSTVPIDSICSISGSANASSSSASSNSKSLGNPRIITISPKKKSE
jgi:hypothetical protein